MRFFGSATALLVACLTLEGCSAPNGPVPSKGGGTRDESADLARLYQAKEALDYAWERGRVMGVDKTLADDVVLVPPGEPVQIGRQAARDWLLKWTRSLLMRDTYVTEAFDVAGPFGVETWTIARLVTEGGKQRRVRLKGISIYRRQPNGQFLLERRMWNLSPAHGADQDLR